MFYKISLFILLLASQLPLQAQSSLQKQIRSMIRDKQAKIGVAISFNGKIYATVNDHKGYAMMSTFKFPVALAVLHRLDQQNLPLSTELYIPKSDLLPNTYSPLRDQHPNGEFQMTISELLKYCIALSDNNACDILIKYIGGIEKVQQYLDQLGIKGMEITATEAAMHQGFDCQNLNRTRPSAAAELIERFMEKNLFAPTYQEFLENTLIETSTGTNKLKGLLPANTIVGHKTGSSDRNSSGMKIGDNDMGFVWLPNGKHYTIAVFVMNSMEDDTTNAAIIAEISKVVYNHLKEK